MIGVLVITLDVGSTFIFDISAMKANIKRNHAEQKEMKRDTNRILRMLKETIKADLLKLKTKVVEIEKDLKVFKGSTA